MPYWNNEDRGAWLHIHVNSTQATLSHNNDALQLRNSSDDSNIMCPNLFLCMYVCISSSSLDAISICLVIIIMQIKNTMGVKKVQGQSEAAV